MKKFLIVAAAVLAAASLAGCQRSYQNVGPNDIGMMLTPTGYENKIYTPGQADIGIEEADGEANSLVLIQRSGIQVKEPFTGPAANADHEDHRCMAKNGEPITLDVRLLFALPDYNTPQGKADLHRIFLLGNPKPVQGGDARVLRISAESVYAEQAQQAVRGMIRQLCASYADFDAMNLAFADTTSAGLVSRIETSIQGVLRRNNVPLRLVSAYPSNMKPDPAVVAATVRRLAATKANLAIGETADYLAADSTGSRRLVYQMQATQEIVARGNANNHNTIVIGPGATSLLVGQR